MKLLIADDHTLFRDTLVQYIERASPGSRVVLAKDFDEVRKILAVESDFDLILLDFRMPGMRGFDGLKYIREKFPQKPVAIMSGVAEQANVKQALELGAKGYFPKTLSGKALIEAIQSIVKGDMFVPYDADNKTYMPAYYDDPPEPGAAQAEAQANFDKLGLTPRETQIMGFLTSGATNKDIAQALGLQVVTVKLHVRSICRKLGVKNRTQAALKLRDFGPVRDSRKDSNKD